MSDAKKILLDAADLLEKHGWCRDTQEDDLGQMCVYGAMFKAQYGVTARYDGHKTNRWQADQPMIDACFALGSHLKLEPSGDGSFVRPPFRIADWNNAEERTSAEVIAALKAAAETIPDNQEAVS